MRLVPPDEVKDIFMDDDSQHTINALKWLPIQYSLGYFRSLPKSVQVQIWDWMNFDYWKEQPGELAYKLFRIFQYTMKVTVMPITSTT